MVSLPLVFLGMVAAAVADPKPPALTFLYTSNLTIPAPVALGSAEGLGTELSVLQPSEPRGLWCEFALGM